MKWTAIVLLVGVFVVFNTPHWTLGYPPNWAFHGKLGIWIAALSGVAVNFFLTQPRSPWRNLAIAALCISAIEGIEVPACILAIDPANVNRLPKGSLCDYVAGFPIGYVIEAIYFLVVLRIIWRSHAK